MPAHDFSFALQLSDEPHFDNMLTELASAVCIHVGLGTEAMRELTADLRRALAAGAVTGHQRCDLRFRASAGALEIVVAFGGRDDWRTSRLLPA